MNQAQSGQTMEFLKKLGSALKKKFVSILLCSGIVFGCWYVLFQHYRSGSDSGLIHKMENLLLDFRFTTRGVQKAKNKIGILAIDEKAIQQFGRFPFSRQYYAQAFANLKKRGVKFIGFDSVFAEPERPTISDVEPRLEALTGKQGTALNDGLMETMAVLKDMKAVSPADQVFAEGVQNFGNIVLGYFYFESEKEVTEGGRDKDPYSGLDKMAETNAIQALFLPEGKELASYPDTMQARAIVTNLEPIASASQFSAFFSNNPDNDAIVRWVTMVKIINGNLMPSLSLKMAAEAMDRDIAVFFNDDSIESISLVSRVDDGDTIDVPIDPLGQGRIVLNHRGPNRESFTRVSLGDAYNDKFPEGQLEFLKDSILLMGATAIGINDQRPNAFDPTLDGVENHAAALDNILAKDFLKRPQDIYLIELGMILVIGLFFSPIMIWSRAAYSGMLALLFLVGYYYFDKYYWFNRGTWAYMGMPFIEISGLFVTVTLYKYVVEEREKRKVQGAFAHYLSPDVIAEVLASDSLNLGGVRKQCTVFFSDVRNFTTISENMKPEDLSRFMNEYFTPMTAIILQSKGCLDKYIGDAIMAFWGAPIPLDDQADIACESAVKMLYALEEVRKSFKAQNFPFIDIGIGLNTGLMSVGNMGSDERMAYTVMGDSVNLGARLEGLTKDYGIKIMISEFTVKHMRRPKSHIFRDLDDIKVKGKNDSVRVFELMRPDALPQEAALRNLIGEFEQGREAYRKQDWATAEMCFMKCLMLSPDDGPAHAYLKRIKDYKGNPYMENWDGVYTFKHK
jgi:adenylate cyclase